MGHIISESGVEIDPDKVRAVERMNEPLSLKDVRVFLGLVGYYRKFIPSFGKTAEPFCTLLNKSNKFEWSTECKNVVTEFKKKLLDPPVLGYPNNRDPYTLTTDPSYPKARNGG